MPPMSDSHHDVHGTDSGSVANILACSPKAARDPNGRAHPRWHRSKVIGLPVCLGRQMFRMCLVV